MLHLVSTLISISTSTLLLLSPPLPAWWRSGYLDFCLPWVSLHPATRFIDNALHPPRFMSKAMHASNNRVRTWMVKQTLPDVIFFFIQSRFWENVDHLSPIIFGEKGKRKEPSWVRPRYGHVNHVCKISGLISQKRRGHFDFFCT